MPLQRRETEVTAIFEGVHFEMSDDLSERVRCFHTRAGFEKLTFIQISFEPYDLLDVGCSKKKWRHS
jgi:hypothetical protein